VRILRLVKLLKLVRLLRSSGFLRKVQVAMGPGLLRLSYLSFVAVVIIHWMACAFYYAAYLQVGVGLGNWRWHTLDRHWLQLPGSGGVDGWGCRALLRRALQ
jgi:hypothetical protein